MTAITLQNGRVVFPAGKVGTGQPCCCPCGPPCQACVTGCLSVTISGFSGGEGCQSCEALNGTYSASRGDGFLVTAFATVLDVYGLGIGGLVELLLEYNSADGTYSVVGVEVIEGGVWYGEDNVIGSLHIQNGFVACGDDPVVEFHADRIAPPQPPAIGIAWAYTQVAQGFQSRGFGARLRVLWEPLNEAEGEETWEVDGIIVDNGGRFYQSQETIRLRAGGDYARFMLEEFIGRVEVDHAQPEVDEFQVDTDEGVGAQFSATFSLNDDLFDLYSAQGFDGRYWQITALSIANAGTGYAVGDRIRYSIAGQHETAPALFDDVQDWYDIAVVNSVGENGEITSLGFPSPGPNAESHFSTSGEIQYIVIDQAGEFYWPGPIVGGTVISGGTIYPNNPCSFSVCDSVQCGEETVCRKVRVSVGSGSASLSVEIDGIPTLTASASSPDPEDCTSLSFDAEDMSLPEGCSAGTITISSGDCGGGPSPESCCIPSDGPGGGGIGCPPDCNFIPGLLWAVSSIGCDPTLYCDANVDSTVVCVNGGRDEFGFVPTLCPDFNSCDILWSTWQYAVEGLRLFSVRRTVIANGIGDQNLQELSEVYDVILAPLGCGYQLVSATCIISHQRGAGDGGPNPSGSSISRLGQVNPLEQRILRPYCLTDFQDTLTVKIDISGITFGTQRFDFSITEQSGSFGPAPPLVSLNGLGKEETFVISGNIPCNPLP